MEGKDKSFQNHNRVETELCGLQNEMKEVELIKTDQDKEINPIEKNQSRKNSILSRTLSISMTDNPELNKEMDPTKIAKNNLLFEFKKVSALKLYFHLSYRTEVLLMIFGLIGALVAGVANPFSSYLNGKAITESSYLAEDQLNSMTEQERKMSYEKYESDMKSIFIKYLYFGAIFFVAFFVDNCFWEYAGLRQLHHLKEKYFALLLKQEQEWYDINNPFEFSTKVQAQLDQIEGGLGERFATILECIGTVISGLIIGFCASWKLTLIILCVSPFLGLSVYFMVKNIRIFIFLSRKSYEVAGGVAEEILYNIKTVASFANFEFEKKRFNELNDQIYLFDCRNALIQGFCMGLVQFFFFISFVVCIYYSQYLLRTNKDKDFGPGILMQVLFPVTAAVKAISTIGGNISSIQEACIASSDYFSLLEIQSKKEEKDNTEGIKPNRDEIKGHIEFKKVSFYYPSDPNKRKILDEIDIDFEAGKKIALVGESGCGKSTTINLIEKLYKNTDGQILLDGVDIKEYNTEYLRSIIGYVQQEPVLMNDSIKNNIYFGRMEYAKEISNGDPERLMKEACKEAFATEFIERIPDKYEYSVGIKGSKLSGGQKQRIAIARAVLCKPKILILDEATSALDNKSEKKVQKALDNISNKNITTIIIAHRLSTIENADIIYCLKEGKVVEKGSHKELLEKQGFYAGLVKNQIQKENVEKMSRKQSSFSQFTQVEEEDEDSVKPEKTEEKKELLKVDRKRLFRIFKNKKLLLFGALISSLFLGVTIPIEGYNLAICIGKMSSQDPDKIKKGGLLHGSLYFLIALWMGGFNFFKENMMKRVVSYLQCSLRKIIYDKYLNFHVGYFDLNENSPGSLLSKLSIDTTQLHCLILILLGDTSSTIGTLISGLIIGCIYDYKIILINVAFMPFIVIAQVYKAYTKQGSRDDYRKVNVEAGGILSECLTNTKTVFSFNFQKEAVNLYINVLNKGTKHFLTDSIFKGFLVGIGDYLIYIAAGVTFYCSSKFIKNESLKYEDLVICLTESITIGISLELGLKGLVYIKAAKKAFDSIFRILDTPVEIDVSEEFNKNKISAKDIKGQIEFKNVSFAYPTKPNFNVLNGISFKIEPGQAVALVGYSGCGKSTIIQLLERFYDVKKGNGEILIDDKNIQDYNLLELRKKIGLVSQEPVLFKRSVFENIKYGKLDATKQEVFEAAKKASIEKFFNNKEMGTKTDPVSGGEKQRLSIARMFIKNPVIILLDEATSALDKKSELEVQKSLYDLQKERTSITIAHRLSTIIDSDIIFFLENGQILEKGTHQELLDKKGKYKVLYESSMAN